MNQKIIGRRNEQFELQHLKESNSPELVAVYGRRRVGKTFLIREFFQNQFVFYHTGVSPLEIKEKQLTKRQLKEIRELTKNRRNIHLTLITTFGLHNNEYSGRFQKTINMDDLFV